MTSDADVFDPYQQRWRSDVETYRHEHHQRTLDVVSRQLPGRFAQAMVDEPQVQTWVDQYTTGSHRSLLLLGPTGVGKTHQAAGAVVAGVARLCTVWAPQFRYVTAPDLYAALRPRPGVDSETTFAGYANCDLLLLDDLGASKPSEWTEEINYRLVNHRYNHQLPMIVTSNTVPTQLAGHVGERVASRLSEMCTVAVIKGGDRRVGGGR